jgi:hypothetical protein
MTTERTLGDEWANHYRGYRLQINPAGDVWWQAYQGTDRLFLDPVPSELTDALLTIKHLGGRVRITEANDVLTQIERGGSYETVWVGRSSLSGELVPTDTSEYSIPIAPDEIESRDLWPSVYDGAKYSFGPGGDRLWWSNPDTHKRHPVQTALPSAVTATLTRLKPRGGSFRVTPWNHVLTLVDQANLPSGARAAFDDLPRVVKNLIALRKDRGGVTKIPVYVGRIDKTPLRVTAPPSLTDPVSADDLGLDGWTDSLGTTTTTDPEEHTADNPSTHTDIDTDSGDASHPESEFGPKDVPDDDPSDW